MNAEPSIATQSAERSLTLTDAELWFCKTMGGLRAVMARRVGVLDRRMGPQDPLAADEDGLMAEFAFSKVFNVFFDPVPDPRNGTEHHAASVKRGADLLDLAIRMRAAQIEYYRCRDRQHKQGLLIAAKQLEAEFDKEVKS
jgi:hypothetical protein